MGETSAIQWTDASVNFWWGCTKVGPGCDHCYAETWSKRTGEAIWGVGAPRLKIKGATALMRKINEKRPGSWVFVQSMSDLFDNEVPLEWFAEAWAEIVGPSYIFSMTWHGRRFTGIVVDHALEFRKQQKYLGHQLLDTMRAMVR